MKSRPIIFGADMVRAILEGRKTQTRRTRGIERINMKPNDWQYKGISNEMGYVFFNPSSYDKQKGEKVYLDCPYGQVGDQLWVRETFYVQLEIWQQHHNAQPIHYVADTPPDQVEDYVKKSCRFMPRWASRITLEITKIRVERVQEIDKRDKFGQHIDGGAWAEGIRCPCPTAGFILLWTKLNEKRGYGWLKNPWVWVIEFKEIKK